METTNVTMTTAEYEELQAFRKAQAEKVAKEQRKRNLEIYNEMIDEQVSAAVPVLKGISEDLSKLKKQIFNNFKALLEMKKDVMQYTKEGQRTHTFMSADGAYRLTLGYYVNDNYKDTVNDGIDLIKEVISGMAKDAETQALVDIILRLLSKDQKGNLKASRVLQLRSMADKINDKRFSEGVEVIMDAYSPIQSKQFIRIEQRASKESEWEIIPLSITDVKI